jgi:hypothetical protein
MEVYTVDELPVKNQTGPGLSSCDGTAETCCENGGGTWSTNDPFSGYCSYADGNFTDDN